MRSKAYGILITAWLAALLPQLGCTTIAKQALHEVRGAQARVHPINRLSEGALKRYELIRFEPATTTVGPVLCPRDLLDAYDRYTRALQDELQDQADQAATSLTAHSEILFFQEKGLLGSAMCLTRVRMRNSDELVLDAMVLAESKSFREGDEDDLAKASVKAIGKFLKKYRQPEGAERPERSEATR